MYFKRILCLNIPIFIQTLGSSGKSNEMQCINFIFYQKDLNDMKKFMLCEKLLVHDSYKLVLC